MPSSPYGSPAVLAVAEALGHDPDELRARAEELLSRPPYTEAEPGLWSRAVRWVGEVLARALQAVADGIGATGRLGAWTIAIVGAVALLIVVWRLTRGATMDPRSPEIPAVPPARSAASWATEARDHEQAGRHRDAIRCWYVALAVGLVEEGVVDDQPGRTVRELDAEVARATPDRAQAIADAGAIFEAVVYGDEPGGPDQVRRVRETAGVRVRAYP